MDASEIEDESVEQRRAKRRMRLQKLRGIAQPGTGVTVGAAAEGFGGRAAGAGPRAAGAGPRAAGGPGEDGANNAARQRAFQRAYRVLTETPADGSGTVAGTPFTEAGVVRLLEALRTRAANPEGPGGKVASRLLQFLNPAEGETDQVHGASLEKLQRIAKMAQNFGSGRGGRGGARL